MKKIFIAVAVIAILALIIVKLFHNKKSLDAAKVVVDRSVVPVMVSTIPVAEGEVKDSFAIAATLAAFDQAEIAAASSGRIVRLMIDLGVHVTKGQVIGFIDARENEQKLAADSLSLAKLTRDYERNKILVAGNATNATAVPDSKYDVDSKKLDIAQLQTQIDNARIISPIDGIITDRKLMAGEYVNTGSSVATVVDVKLLKAKVYVPENKVFTLHVGQTAVVTADAAPGERFTGTVTYISPQGDDNHNYQVQLFIQNDRARLKAGQYVMAAFNPGSRYKALQIPQAAVGGGNTKPFVYVAEDGRAVVREIVPGRNIEGHVEVLSGLREGEKVIVNGQINLVNGSKVTVLN